MLQQDSLDKRVHCFQVSDRDTVRPTQGMSVTYSQIHSPLCIARDPALLQETQLLSGKCSALESST